MKLRPDPNNEKSQNGASYDSRKPPLIHLEKVNKSYKTAAGPFPALKDINMQVWQGEFLIITGKSGAGKTTLVNMISGTDHLTSGNVWVDGVDIQHFNENQAARWRGRNLGVIYQSFHLIPNLSLIDNVALPMDFNGHFRWRESRKRALELLRQVELEEHARKLPGEISGGQQQRVAIARALANDPPIIVADEPTGRLDSTTAGVIYEIFQSLVAQGKTIVMVTHDQGIIQHAARALVIQDGELFEVGDEALG